MNTGTVIGKIEVSGDVRNLKSGNMTSSGDKWSHRHKNASPKMGQDQMSGGVSVL